MNVNFIITAHRFEDYVPVLKNVLMSYKVIQPNVVLAYNGPNRDFDCNIRVPNRGHQEGDLDLTIRGYDFWVRRNNFQRFIKTGLDTFLLDEQVLLKIFADMEAKECGYAGNRWGHETDETLATDIIFLDTQFGSPFDGKFDLTGPSFECWMWRNCFYKRIKCHFLKERIPVHHANRHRCAKLKWTMHHELAKNIADMRDWGYGHLT